MIRLARYSERFQASGGVSARATHRALGVHGLDFWKLFLRETIQNSWDARTEADGPINFGVHAWQASPVQRHLLRDVILDNPPAQLGFPAVFNSGPLELLVVADSGTWGLGGPTRADIDVTSVLGGRTDFVDLVRDSGRRATKGFAGGTYGFGKVVLCEASAVSTVVIYSRIVTHGALDSRFVAMAIGGDEYHEDGARYTGRHWWGVVDNDVAEPTTNRDADAAAVALGLRDLIDGPTGTAIMIVAPRTPDDSGPAGLGEITTAITDAANEYAWPHLFAEPTNPTIRFSVTLNGTLVNPHDLTRDERLKMLVEAYNTCRNLQSQGLKEGDAWPWYTRRVKSERPLRELGALSWRHYGSFFLPVGEDPEVRSEIALVRSPRFVVSYMGVPEHPSGQSTLGVFLADPDLDEDFARSEPPTHDSWNPTKGREFNPARQVLKKIPDLVKPRPASGASRHGRDDPGVVAVASALGGLLDGQQAWGDIRIAMTTGGSSQRPAPAIGAPPAQPSTDPNDNSGVSGSGSGFTSSVADPTTPGSMHTGIPNPLEPAGGGRADTGISANGGSGPRPLRRPTVKHDGQFRLLIAQGCTAVEFPFTVQKPSGYGAVQIAARPEVFIDGGCETEAPLATTVPAVLEWRDQVTGAIAYGSYLAITQDGESRWSVVVSQPDDVAVTVTLLVEPR